MNNNNASMVPFRNLGSLDISNLNSSYEIHDYLEDRLAGVTITERIYSGTGINSAYIARCLSDPAVAQDVSSFFTSRALRSVLPALLQMQQWRVGGFKTTLPRVLEALTGKLKTQAAVGAVMEIIAPGFMNNEVIVPASESTPIMNRFTIPFDLEPEIGDLVREASRLDLEAVINGCSSAWRVERGQTYSSVAAAEECAKAYYPIGRALRSSYDYSVVFSDIVKAIYVRLSPTVTDRKGMIPKSILDHTVVTSLMTNWTFVRAALRIVPGSSVTCDLSEFTFDKWAGAAVALLRSSDRFAFRSRSDSLKNYGLRHVPDLRGVRRASVFYEHAEMEPLALSVVAIQDDMLPDAINIDTTTGRIDAHLAASYGSFCKTFSIQEAVGTLTDMLSHSLEMEAIPVSRGVYMHTVRDVSVAHVAMMLADSIMYDPSSPDDVVYCLKSSGRLELTSGVEVKGYVYTRDPAEVLLASDGCATPVKSDALPQLLPRAALGTHLFSDAKNDVFIKSGLRFAFNQEIGSTLVRGSVKLNEFETSRHDADASLVHPVYNDQVYRAARGVFEDCIEIARTIEGGEAVQKRLKRQVAQALVLACRGIAPAFRSSVHALLQQKTMKDVDQADVRLMAARLNQSSIRAFSDMFAVAFFLAIQGIGIQFETEVMNRGIVVADESKKKRDDALDPLLTSVWKDEDMAEMMVEYGSDIKPR